MPRGNIRKILQEVDEFSAKWQRFAELMTKTVVERKTTIEDETESLKLSAEIMQKSVSVAQKLGMQKTFVQQVADFLEDVFDLSILVDMQEFQITLLRERWNAVQLDINSYSARMR